MFGAKRIFDKMDKRLILVLVCVLQTVYCDDSARTANGSEAIDYPPYIKVVLCPMQKEPWECLRQQSVRMLDVLDNTYQARWSEFKDEASRELLSEFQARGFSASEKVREKTSSLFEKIETGVEDIKEFAESTANELMGRDEGDFEDETDVEYEDEESDVAASREEEVEEEEEEDDTKDDTTSQIKKKKKKKKKKKPVHEYEHEEEHGDDYEEAELAAHLLGGVDSHGGGHGIKLPHKYGRSLGVTRGKKKKKKKALMKIVLVASLIKAKIEILLKLLSAHLQIKFFAIALFGLLLNLIRFWLDIKRGQAPQKVIYYEHAHHQHHYDDHEDWDAGGGGYWRRTNSDPAEYNSGGYDEDSPYSRIGRNDYIPSAPSTGAALTASQKRITPNQMAYVRQIPSNVRSKLL